MKGLEELIAKYQRPFLIGVLFGLVIMAIILMIGLTTEESPPELYFPNQDENGFFPLCIDGFMAGCTPKGCVPSEPVIECQVIKVNLGESG